MANKLQVAAKQEVSIDKDFFKYLLELKDVALTKELPSAVEFEQVVLGAILLDKEAFSIVNEILEPTHFYEEKHKIVYEAFSRLHKSHKPIDLLMATQELNVMKKLTKVGGPHYIVELTNRVASAANIEYHSQVIYRQYLKREGVKYCAQYLKKFMDPSVDVFHIRNDFSDKLRVLPPTGFFQLDSITKAMERGAVAPELLKMCGTLWNKTEVCFFFGPSGVGKSIFSIQIANALSKGEDVIPDILINECDPQKVLYIDFELSDRNLKDRYSNKETKSRYEFNDENIIRASINPEFLDYDTRLDKIAQQQIENLILKFKPDAMIVDNITFLTSESNHDTDVAKKLMKKLVFYKRKYDLSLLVIAHTTKGTNKFIPLEDSHMAGSAQLMNFADAMFGVKRSALDENLTYLKQFKDRNESMVLTDENVMVAEIGKGGTDYNFLQYRFNSFAREREHLALPEGDDGAMQLLMYEACKLKADKGPMFGYRKVATELNIKNLSTPTLIKKMKAYAEESFDFEVKDGHITYKLPFTDD